MSEWSGRRLHFIAIGGAGMSGLALIARALGAEVTGSDREESSYVERLRANGIEPVIGHDAANVPAGAEVVVSTAIGEDNPELAAARAAGLRILHRADLLAEIAALKRCLAITGTHGKTTTAAMAAHAMTACGLDPGYVIGGELRSTDSNAGWGEGEWVVVEADESDRSFLKLSPDAAVVTNVELDHHATYRSEMELTQAVEEFLSHAGAQVVWERERLPRTVSFGIHEGDLRAEGVELVPGGSRFEVDGVAVELQVPGEHNVLNALAALGGCREAGLALEQAAAALKDFPGVARRFESRGSTPGGALVFDDYAHHPTEVRATLAAARTLDARRVVACFQPHLYSRTKHLAKQFGQALALADVVVVLEVYPARERAEDWPGVSGMLVAGAAADAAAGRPVWWLPQMDVAAEFLRSELGEGDVLLTLGAGDVWKLAEGLTASS